MSNDNHKYYGIELSAQGGTILGEDGQRGTNVLAETDMQRAFSAVHREIDETDSIMQRMYNALAPVLRDEDGGSRDENCSETTKPSVDKDNESQLQRNVWEIRQRLNVINDYLRQTLVRIDL